MSQIKCFDLLPDEMVVEIGSWLASYEIKNFVQFQRTCHRMRSLLGQREVISGIVKDRELSPDEITTLEHLALYEYMDQEDLLQENRIGFDYASTEIDDDDGEASGVKGSWTRINSVQTLLSRFKGSVAIVDSHCGTMGPRGVAPRFSQIRGMEVCSALSEQDGDDDDSDLDDRLTLNSWGRQVSDVVYRSTHRYGDLAREGKGWVEIYLQLGDLELPQRPGYYHGLWTVG
jgi:hypothetical protein